MTTPHLIFSGIQPTGDLHIGNYLGAIKPWASLQSQHPCIYCIVDAHAITVFQDPEQLNLNTREVAAAVIAAGIDPSQHILFNQSENPHHAELNWIFSSIVRMGWLSRMTQFKEKSGKNREKASLGLFAYPSLMAADILAYHANLVPVGEDQTQHLELANNIAQKFNHDYQVDFFPSITPIIQKTAARVMSLRNGSAKMSKSDPSPASRIHIKDSNDKIHEKIQRAKTDPECLPDNIQELALRPEALNLVSILAALSDTSPQNILDNVSGWGFSQFKPLLTEKLISVIEPLRDNMIRILNDELYLLSILKNGAEQAQEKSAPIIQETKKIIGFLKT
jgi:tryptophanyl-tRNA synthetase